MFFHLSQSVGSGKTQAVLEFIRDNFNTPYLFVAPTVALCEEVYQRLLLALKNHKHELADGLIQCVVTDENLGEVYPRAAVSVREIGEGGKGVVIVTETTFQFLLSDMSEAEGEPAE